MYNENREDADRCGSAYQRFVKQPAKKTQNVGEYNP